jgi:GxxExxY protein
MSARMLLQTSDLVRTVIGACIEVHRWLGPGLLESAYRACLQKELRAQGVPFDSEVSIPVIYRGEPVDCRYRIDFWFADELIVELKSVENLLPVHSAQLLTYLRLTGAKQGLLINFNVPVLKAGIRSLML